MVRTVGYAGIERMVLNSFIGPRRLLPICYPIEKFAKIYIVPCMIYHEKARI